MRGPGLIPDPQLRTFNHGQTLMGGSPITILKLSEAGARTVASWFGGAEVGGGANEQALSTRLLTTGMAHPVVQRSTLKFAVVIPVRHDKEGLEITLRTLGPDESLEVIIVDDSGPEPRGPAATRNMGAAETSAEVLVFVDAGVEITLGAIEELVDHLQGPTVASAPRVSATPTGGAIGAYESRHSPLDLGALPGIAAPGNRVSYVPSTVLAIRHDAFSETGGFDETLRYGEDVDLIWRLGSTGETRYVPSVKAQHPPRKTLQSFARQRFNYGTSAGPLATRHGNAVAPVALSAWSVVTLILTLVPLPKTLLIWLTGLSFGLSKKIPEPAPLVLATGATLAGNFAAIESVAKASTRAWWPLAVVGLATPLRTRVVVGWFWSWARHRSILGLVDDVAYGAGVWRGTLRASSARSVLPRISFGRSQSKRSNS